ncbi:hypothetical protein Tco_0911739 [Tanacetum coccineum]|uniref:Uncharacterized protein n=1 Tax=Tanacetum coccineum TaxID=301880 RepID=A0ABQ5D3S8_9ASTR
MVRGVCSPPPWVSEFTPAGQLDGVLVIKNPTRLRLVYKEPPRVRLVVSEAPRRGAFDSIMAAMGVRLVFELTTIRDDLGLGYKTHRVRWDCRSTRGGSFGLLNTTKGAFGYADFTKGALWLFGLIDAKKSAFDLVIT